MPKRPNARFLLDQADIWQLHGIGKNRRECIVIEERVVRVGGFWKCLIDDTIQRLPDPDVVVPLEEDRHVVGMVFNKILSGTIEKPTPRGQIAKIL